MDTKVYIYIYSVKICKNISLALLIFVNENLYTFIYYAYVRVVIEVGFASFLVYLTYFFI